MSRKKTVLIIIFAIFFILGFLTHAFFFPHLLTGVFIPASQEKTDTSATAPLQDQMITKVIYKDGKFTPRVVRIKKSYYISIVNMSAEELMWLTSANSLLTTPRGYGQLEHLQTILYAPGIYEVSSILHPTDKLQVIVK